MPDFDTFTDKLEAENKQYGHGFKTKEEIDADLERAAERKAAVDQQKSDLAGTEVAHAMAVAAEHRASEENSTSVHTGRTAEDVQHDLDLAAERKKRIDDERAAKAGADYKHVMEVVQKKKQSVDALQSEREKLDSELAEMAKKQQQLEAQLGATQ